MFPVEMVVDCGGRWLEGKLRVLGQLESVERQQRNWMDEEIINMLAIEYTGRTNKWI